MMGFFVIVVKQKGRARVAYEGSEGLSVQPAVGQEESASTT